MNITVQVDDVTLDSLIHGASEYGKGSTIGDEVAALALQRLLTDRDGWNSVASRVQAIRDEEIREAVRPLITDALTRPFRKTNSFGEPVGEETTLSALIVSEARAMFTKQADSYSRSGQTVAQKIVAEEVATAFRSEVADAVKQARELVAGQIGEQVAAAVSEGMRKR